MSQYWLFPFDTVWIKLRSSHRMGADEDEEHPLEHVCAMHHDRRKSSARTQLAADISPRPTFLSQRLPLDDLNGLSTYGVIALDRQRRGEGRPSRLPRHGTTRAPSLSAPAAPPERPSIGAPVRASTEDPRRTCDAFATSTRLTSSPIHILRHNPSIMSEQFTDNTILAAGHGIAQSGVSQSDVAHPVAHPVARHAIQNDAPDDAHQPALDDTHADAASANDAQADIAPAPTAHSDAASLVSDATTMSRDDIAIIQAVLEFAHNTAFTSAHDATHVGTGEALNAFSASDAGIRAAYNFIRDILPELEATHIGTNNYLFAAAITGGRALPPNASPLVRRRRVMRRSNGSQGGEGTGGEGNDEAGRDGRDLDGDGGAGNGDGDAGGAGMMGMA
ncbi:hypothetical protein PENSPDRAFT_671298 [Peniophora sp. CONT]|nr:hypothetical protein PENSPDRAFT_671298 [Peniophora sp. CONT]